MNILILASQLDIDAQIVKWGLQQLNCEVTILDWEDFPIHQKSSWEISNSNTPQLAFLANNERVLPPFDVIWNRRPGQPTPNAPAGSQDFKIIHAESMLYLRNTVSFLGHATTLWVNPFASAQRAELKMLQLTAAKALGFAIPATLISNDFNQVKAFFDSHKNGIIYKAFAPGKWRNADGSATVLRTNEVTAANFAYPEAINACPGIYQEHIKKAYELRVTVIGDKVLAGKIDSQANGKSVDWRYDGVLMDIALTATALPSKIADLCVALCRNLDLVFGCIDLIVDVNGDYIFLELNQAGQFLWNESLAPELPMIDTFCRYLASGGASDIALPACKLTLNEWEKSPAFAAFQKCRIAKYGAPPSSNTAPK